uniref:Ig-like domain-containing protein n=1 Tax=Amphiprion percula TaxID=161767 RepID=A0A3P8STD5_AMPPE
GAMQPSLKREGKLQTVEAVKGAAAQLECEITGTAPFEISWLKNKKTITSDQKYTILSQDSVSRLEIQMFESADIGDYQCVISNDVGKVTTKASCVFVEPPTFSKRVESVTAVLGTTVKLQGTIKGSAPITVKWMKDSDILRDDDPNIKMLFESGVASLSIATVVISHGGKYSCKAVNEAGQQKCEATVTVQEPARIVEPAESISVTAGDSATLECTISGSPELKVKWFKDGKEMISGRKYKMTLKDNIASMKILTAEKGDTSEYKMEVANKVGKDQCTVSMFFLQQPDRIMPPTFTKSLKRVDGNVGSDVSMDCKVSGSQPMTITWFKDEQEIVSGVKFQPEFKDSSAMLRIAWLEKADSGVYTCRANNSAGFKETSGTLYVKEPPVFTATPENQELIPGATVSLRAAFTGTPPLAIKWFREEKEIITGGFYFIKKEASSSSLELHSVKPSDSAKYTCQVSNDAGKVDCTTVLFPPVFVRKLEATKLVTSSDSVRLECKVTGSPVISFRWFKDEMEISSGPRYSMSSMELVAALEIVQCAVEDSGDYVCLASSEAGSDRCSSTVTVKGWFNSEGILCFSAHFSSGGLLL